jgi:magnesium-transporting ATPase (P-type)
VTAVNIGSVRSRRRTASPERGCAAPPGERRRRIRRGRTESEGADHPGAAKGVGCLGDGINDASALHAADVGISVNNAVDVAREAAAIVLLEKDLRVLLGGVREGRTTFANTLKYVLMTTSANFGKVLLLVLKATPRQFQTGWFLVSVVTELLIVPVIHTRRPFYQSRMGRPLLVSTVVVLAASEALPYLPFNQWLGFTPPPPAFLLAVAVITTLYLLASEAAKRVFYRRI